MRPCFLSEGPGCDWSCYKHPWSRRWISSATSKSFLSPPLISSLACRRRDRKPLPRKWRRRRRLVGQTLLGTICHNTFVVASGLWVGPGEWDPAGEVRCVSQHFLGNQNYISAGVISNRGKEALPHHGWMSARAMTRQSCSKNNHVITDTAWEKLVAHSTKFLWRSSCSCFFFLIFHFLKPSENIRSVFLINKHIEKLLGKNL